MRLVTWNVNSVRVRAGHVAQFLRDQAPDLLLLQEIKCQDAMFPAADFTALGYHCTVSGQKSYNGVAILSRDPVDVTCRQLPGLPDDDAQARYLEIDHQGIVIGNLYLPNGNSGGDAGYAYKLAWMQALYRRAEAWLRAGRDLVLAGDFNVCPTSADLAPGVLPPTDALVRPETRAAFRSLLWLGLTDAVRALHPDQTIYTFWDYLAGAWPQDRGLRIDHMLLSAGPAERLLAAMPDRAQRGREQPSDHVPLVVDLW